MIKYNDLRDKLLADPEVKEEYEQQKLESFNDELNDFLNFQLKGEKIAYNQRYCKTHEGHISRWPKNI